MDRQLDAEDRAMADGVHGGWVRRGGALAMALVLAAGAVACSSDDGDGGTSEGTTPQAAPAGVDLPAALGPADVGGEPQDGGRLVFGLEAEPDGLDPSRSTFDASGHLIASAVYDPLVTIDGAGEAVPYLAESIEPNGDATRWEITLREGVTFHDDTPLDAEALKVNFDYWTESFVTQGSLTSVAGYEVVDDLTLAVDMTQPWTAFPYVLSTQTGYVASPTFLQSPIESGPSVEAVGTGPFEYRSYEPGVAVDLARNPDYWQEGLPHLDEMRFAFIPDPLTRVNALTEGDIDMLHGYQPAILDVAIPAAEAGDLKVVVNGSGEEDVIAINTAEPPFDDLVARQALAHATDAAAWQDLAEADGFSVEVTSPFVEGQLGYTPDDAFPGYDLEEARRLAAEYEATHGSPITAELVTTDLVVDQQLAELLTAQWAEAGIEVTVRSTPLALLIAEVVLGGTQLATWRNFGSIDPDGDYLWWHSSAVQDPPLVSTNVSRFADDEIDAALDAARATDDEAVRDEQYQIVSQRLNEGVAVVWLGRPTWVLAALPRVQGLVEGQVTMATLGEKAWLAELWLA